jgi:hypothetical protein
MHSKAIYYPKGGERMKRKTRCPTVVELKGKVSSKSSPLSLASDPGDSRFRWGL